jgi:hypothetical protein
VVGGTALAAVVVLVAALLAWHFVGGAAGKAPRMSARELLVGQSDFPRLPPPVRFNATSGDGDEPDGGAVNVSPSECNDVLGHTDTTADTARAELSNAVARGDEGPRGYAVRVTKPAGAQLLDNFEAGLDKCQKVTVDREGMKVNGTVKRLSVSGTPVPVVGAAARFTSTAYGVKVAMTMQVFVAVVRGTSVEVSANRMKINGGKGMDAPDDDAVELVNKQVEKIQQAG